MFRATRTSPAARNFERAAHSPAVVLRGIPAAAGRIRGQKLRCASARRGGTKAGSCRGGAAAERRGHVGAEVRHGGAVAERRARVWGRRLRMREQGGAARWLKGAGPGISGSGWIDFGCGFAYYFSPSKSNSNKV